MAKHKEEKTNVMRTLEQKKIPYTPTAPLTGCPWPRLWARTRPASLRLW